MKLSDTIKKKVTKYKKKLSKKGPYFFIPPSIFRLCEHLLCNYYTLKTASTRFTFKKKNYRYFHHIYNHTWGNERRVEIPIIWNLIRNKKSATILEIGNVLSHYFSIAHDVLDKYEKGPSVINEDVVTYKSKKKYDLIVSISTLEHVGWDEAKKDKLKILQAIKNLKTMLSPAGKIIFTVPLGYNPYLDTIVAQGKLVTDECYYLERISNDNLWKESKLDKNHLAAYNAPFPYANGIIIGIVYKSKQ